jgi:glycogen operon protein
VKLIAEPWDVGPGGYQVGNFPVLWTEWNGKYRDLMRSFVKGDAGQLGQFASRLTGSSDLYEHSGRKPHASINFITCHDGFTLTDLVSYNDKHNEANGEENKDGENNNNSWNCGVEGPTKDPNINALRYQQKRNFIALLFFSIGVPMLSGGDELGRTQGGNNNAYCQDTEISWYQWELSDDDKKFLEFVKKVIAIRKDQLVIQRKEFFKGEVLEDGALPKDIIWLSREGRIMEEADWTDAENRAVGVMLEGEAMHEVDVAKATRVNQAKNLLLLANTAHVGVPFFLPEHASGDSWKLLIDTSEKNSELVWKMESEFPLKGRSVVLLELHDTKLDTPTIS